MNPNGLVQTNPVNEISGRHIHNYSTFDKSLSYRLYNTLRFGDYTPSFEMEGVENDEISLNSLDRIDSLSLNAPFKGSIRKIKESFKVPYMAILPMQWDRIYAQNSNGDDVPEDCNCVIKNFPYFFYTRFAQCVNVLYNKANGTFAVADLPGFLTAALRTLVFGEYVYSAGSLLHVSGYKASSQFSFVLDYNDNAMDRRSFDWWFDSVVRSLFSNVPLVSVSANGVTSYFKGLDSSNIPVHNFSYVGSFRSLLEFFRENPTASIVNVFGTMTTENFDLLKADSLKYFAPNALRAVYYYDAGDGSVDIDDSEMPARLNLSRLLAYQLVCAHYFTNSSIDFIYSAELYREYIHSLWKMVDTSNNFTASFTWNGHTLQYDYLSGHCLTDMLGKFGTSFDYAILSGLVSAYPVLASLAAWSAIFGFRKSLRFGDYFTASRPRPLAPINTDVSVNNNMVSVVDVTRNIQAQRFANSVMRTRSKIEDYVKGLFGRAPAPDYHNPFYLIRQEEIVFGDEVQNTAEAQSENANSRTANFASNMDRFTFTFNNDDMHPCIYVQIISFDIRRAYTRSVERQFFHANRFDMFNPDFQYIGDQPIYGVELGYEKNGTIPAVFSYTTRDMEYKQRFDQASGGFLENLPGWILTDSDRSRAQSGVLDPDFIRSYNTELDQFFLSLTGYSLGNYFHFICITDNNVVAHRAMAVDPQILA